MTKTILLGMGAQKAGTTWIHDYLSQHPECAFGKAKELATLFAHFRKKEATAWKMTRLNDLEDICKKARWRIQNDQSSPDEMRVLLERVEAFCATFDLGHYFHYFDRRFAAKPDAKVAGELTPENCTLDIEDLQQVKAMFENRGYRVKVLFLMRDPVDRCFSAIRMGNRLKKAAGKPVWDEHYKKFEKTATADWCQIRTRYEQILPRIEAVFGPEDRHVAFYETLFSDDKIRAFCDFLDITYKPADFGRRSNSSPRSVEPDPQAWAAVRAAYKDTYDFCAERFGADFIADIWHNKAREGQQS